MKPKLRPEDHDNAGFYYARKKVPSHTLEALDRYLYCGDKVGGFLSAVLNGDLFTTFHNADQRNRDALLEIIQYIWNYFPHTAFGSREKVIQWYKAKHLAECREYLRERDLEKPDNNQ